MPLGVVRNTIVGQLKLPTEGSSGGILIGGDALIYRRSSNMFGFDDGFQMLLARAMQCRDDQIYISSDDDGHLDLRADISIDINGPLALLGAIAKGTPEEGDIKWDDTAHTLMQFNGTIWEKAGT